MVLSSGGERRRTRQFFYNSYGEHAHETVEALVAVGAADYAALLRRAIELFPGQKIPRDLEERNAALDALGDEADGEFERLDDRFFALGGDALLARLLTYWNEHAA